MDKIGECFATKNKLKSSTMDKKPMSLSTLPFYPRLLPKRYNIEAY